MSEDNRPEDMRKFQKKFPFMYKKFWELNRAVAAMDRRIQELERNNRSSQGMQGLQEDQEIPDGNNFVMEID